MLIFYYSCRRYPFLIAILVALHRFMRNILRSLVVICVVFASCKKEPQPMSRLQMQYTIDSLTQVRIRESDEQAKRDIEDRIKIEVKVKVDSIVNARLHPVKVDSAALKANAVQAIQQHVGAALPVPAKKQGNTGHLMAPKH